MMARESRPRRLNYWSVVLIAALLVLLGCILGANYAQAAPPPSTMNFQGRLSSPSGSIMPDGQYNMQFGIYSAASGGSALWTETRQTTSRVQVTNGLFAVQLGSVTPLSAAVFDNSNLYFEITMATPATATCGDIGCASWEPPMTPRNQLATSAYAFNAAMLDGRTSADFAPASGSSNYIQNSTTAQAGASFNIAGSGRIGGAFTAAGTSTFSGAMSVNNTTNINSSSSTAFRVQNSGTLVLFTANAADNIIQIGSSSVDDIAVRLVLDSSNAPSDPAGINGAMYYSTAKDKMRCYENGIWKNCDTSKGMPIAVTANYTARDGDFVVADASSGSFVVTLPTPSPGATVSVKKVNPQETNYIMVHGGGAFIDNLSSINLTSQWVSQDFFSDGTRWYRV